MSNNDFGSPLLKSTDDDAPPFGDNIDTLTEQELVIVQAEGEKKAFTMSKSQKTYAWFVLMLVTLAQISNQWQRFVISSVYYFDDAKGDKVGPKYSMKAAIEGMTDAKYGIVAGPAFTIFYSIFVLFTGILSDNFNRKNLLTIASICWSLTSIGIAFSEKFWQVAFFRMLLGVFEACCGPPAYSLISDYFPPESRTMANSVYALGIYVGAALSSLTIIMIEHLGWRWTYASIGLLGIIFGTFGILFMREPPRGRFDIQKVEAVKIEKKGPEVSVELLDES